MSQHSFRNSLGRVITTSFPADVEKYRHDPGFTEITEGAPEESGYAAQNKPDLEAEVAKRNEGRDEADHIVVDGKGNKPDLIAALENDDANNAGD